VLALAGAVRTEGRESLLQAVHGRSPLRSRGLADGILVAELADLVHRPLQGQGLNPPHRPKVLAPLRIVEGLAVVATPSGDFEYGVSPAHVATMKSAAAWTRPDTRPTLTKPDPGTLTHTRSPGPSNRSVLPYQPPPPAQIKPYSTASSHQRDLPRPKEP
jgi:hypothetical protein